MPRRHQGTCSLRSMLLVFCAAGCATGNGMRSAERFATDDSSMLVTAQLHQPLTTERSQAGDHFTLELLDPVVGRDGHELIGRGAVIEGVVRGARKPGVGNDGRFELELIGVRVPDEGLVPLEGEVADAPVEASSRLGRGLVGGLAGAAAGSGVGLGIDSDSAGTVVGSAVVGAGLGALAGTLFGPRSAEIPAGSIVTLRFPRDLRLAQPVAGNRVYTPTRPVVCTPPVGSPQDSAQPGIEPAEAAPLPVPAIERPAPSSR